MTRKLAALVLFLLAALPALAIKRLNVQQLDLALGEIQKKPDEDAARWLSGVELSERISTQKAQHWKDAMPGPLSQRAFIGLADASAFLNPPSDEIPQIAPMDREAQQKLLLLASEYVTNTLSKLPNFFATQAITTFEDTPAERQGSNYTQFQAMHFARFINANVLYRGGKEVMETNAGEVTEKDQIVSPTSGLLSSGEFGPVLDTVLNDARAGKLTWSRWEAGHPWPVAVFRYSVPRNKSHYKVKVLVPGSSYPSQVHPGYHGEIALDSESGTIVRLTLRADLSDDDPMERADLMVEYGPVEIGGKTYTCPVKSVAIVIVPQDSPGAARMSGTILGAPTTVPNATHSQTLLNDVAFEKYHLLRSEARVLTGADTDNDEK